MPPDALLIVASVALVHGSLGARLGPEVVVQTLAGPLVLQVA